ncbi:hypothetical protein M427DRAFT_95808 [Gonapodya prolifera JEL478]|uniref:Nitrate reductase [NADPH] n=1 Tax=Gonapodya prolifera (strain JEL478) TaxID=1344416 RepID=A0A139AR42_GONPJ|nr:hypothetical protein M427DRAFT_95808 [Gonapodya prolifera JEL478]|eukprot:KXS18993.1 hypothetical protein M427DRAFT_95808 [Gonapodya prolifera JEL478]
MTVTAVRDGTGAESCGAGTVDINSQELWNLDNVGIARSERSDWDDVLRVGIQKTDAATPDKWIERSASMTRVTGRHPLNAEADSKILLEAGLVTPRALHYVRNHGPVPNIADSSSEEYKNYHLEPQRFTIDDLRSIASSGTNKNGIPRFPVAFGCDGNRRKEINQRRQTRGSNFGPGAVSCSVWGGVFLRDVLSRASLPDEPESFHVWFEGEEKLHNNSTYGTSFPLCYILDPTNDVMLAFEMNGKEPLPPDHGCALRVIMPGMVGGRQVKWLKRVVISDKPSPSWFHWHDNLRERFLFERERPFFIEVNFTNHPQRHFAPVITHPTHDASIDIKTLPGNRRVEFKGYAYSGGGNKVTSVEVSLDGGMNWSGAKSVYVGGPRHGNKWWGWCHWSFSCELWRLLRCSEVVVRAVDAAGNRQPENVEWNLMGMMNNSLYRVQVVLLEEEGQPPYLKFLHPVLPGTKEGGWLKRSLPETETGRGEGQKRPEKTIPRSELDNHSNEASCWIVIAGVVYDVTAFLQRHPGGAGPILMNAGKDATEEFMAIHADDARRMKEQFAIGTLAEEGRPGHIAGMHVCYRPRQPNLTPDGKTVAINPRRWTTLKLVDRVDVSHDTRKFRFSLPDPSSQRLWLPVGQHIELAAHPDPNDMDKLVIRPYTPVSPVTLGEDKVSGTVELLVKIYPNGAMTQILETRVTNKNDLASKEENKVMIRGPTGHIRYQGKGNFNIDQSYLWANRIAMVAGGTGITPMFQLARAILLDPDDCTRVRLVFSNKFRGDVLLYDELNELAEKSKGKFEVFHTLSHETPKSVKDRSTGTITIQMLKERLFEPHADTIAFVCGPPGLVEKAAKPFLEEIGFDEDHLFAF